VAAVVTQGRKGGQDGRKRILAAALEVFAELGCEVASIADIGERAGFAKSVMYHHFGSKAGLYEAVVEAQTADLVEHVSAALPAPGSGRRLRAGLDAYFAFMQQRPAVWRLLFRDAPTDPDLREAHGRMQGRRAELLASLITPVKAPAGARRNAKALYTELLATAVRAFATWWQEHPKVPREVVVDSVMDVSDAALKRLGLSA
jgi:AcrR family transcriptional regulator